MKTEKRLIDANALRERLQKITADVCQEICDGFYKYGMTKPLIYLAISESPTVNSVEVVHANWIDSEDGETRCSNCETRIPEMYSNADTVIKSECRFCHYCGAKMDG